MEGGKMMTAIKRLMRVLLLGSLYVLSLTTASAQGIALIWAVDDGEKVRQDDLDYWAKADPKNKVWDGTSVHLFGARNEVVAFQLILQASAAGASNVSVVLDSLTFGVNAIVNRPATNDPTNYVGRYIELFVEHYTNVTQRSPYVNSLGTFESRPLPDALHLGGIPDALVPFEATVKAPAHGQGGAPFVIGAQKNQGVWVDIYIPKSAAPGVYTGTIRVTEGSTVVRSIPVQLQVYRFTLPDETHQKSFFHWNELLLSNRYGIAVNSPAYWDMFHKFMNMAHRHRMDLVDGRRPLVGTDGFAQRLAGYYTGEYYSSQYGYEGPGTNVGNRTYSIGTYDQPNYGSLSGFTPTTAAGWQAASDQWEQWFLDHAPQTLRFKYMDDEADVTDPAIVQTIKDKCSWITSGTGVGKNLHRFFTKEFVYTGFNGYIDFWALAGSPGIKLSEVQQRKPNGELFCMYNGTRPMWGNIETIDAFATDNRVNPWIAWKYGIDLLFLWTTSFYAEQNPPSPNARNVWDDNYLPAGQLTYWGGGMLFYTGIDQQYAADSRGFNGPIGCIRMKNFRRGQQDYEYLWLAKQAGIDVSSTLNTVVPRALDDWGTTQYSNPPGYAQQPVFAQQGYIFENARLILAQQLAQSGNVTTMPSGAFSASPNVLPYRGGTTTLTWTSDAASASIDNGIGVVPASGSRQVTVSKTTVFNVQFTNTVGTTTVPATVTVLDSVVIPPPPDGSNIVKNPTFETGTAPWVAFSNGLIAFASASPGMSSAAAARVIVTRVGDNTQLYQSGISLEPSTLYRLTFDARADSAHGLDVSIIRHSGAFASYGVWAYYINLQAQWKSFSIDFTTDPWAAPVTDGRLMYRFGPFAKAGDVYWLDNVALRKVQSVQPGGVLFPKDWVFSQNYPNPFNPRTKLHYSIPVPTKVRMTVYDILGRPVATLVDGQKAAGSYDVEFDGAGLASGLYYCIMEAGGFMDVRKLVLVR
jgi:hypothetical protein